MNANENKTSQPTAEQLMKMLDVQLDMMRSKREKSTSRTGIYIASILFVFVVAGVALFFLMMMLEDARSGRALSPQNTTETTGK